jgi:hypothetical protein
MDIRKTLFRKEMKLVTLLLTSLLVASASAAVYYSMVMEGSVTTAAADIAFVAGGDSTEAGATGYTTDGTWVRLASLKAYPNVTLTYDEAINITNQGGSAHTLRLRHGSISPNNTDPVSNFTSITFKLIASDGTQYGGDFTYSTGGDDTWEAPSDMDYQSIGAGEEWAVKVEIVGTSGATTGQTVEIDIYVDVQ